MSKQKLIANGDPNYIIVTVNGGFYFFGREIQGPEGFISVTEGAMFGGFETNLGMPSVARGDPESSVVLDRFPKEAVQLFPVCNVFAIHPSINLYAWKKATMRGTGGNP